MFGADCCDANHARDTHDKTSYDRHTEFVWDVRGENSSRDCGCELEGTDWKLKQEDFETSTAETGMIRVCSVSCAFRRRYKSKELDCTMYQQK
jgi:hypothetical protein